MLEAGTVTLAGAVATEVLLLVTVTTTPPLGAGFDSVTVAVEVAPAVTELGLSARADTGGTPPWELIAPLFRGAITGSFPQPLETISSEPGNSAENRSQERNDMEPPGRNSKGCSRVDPRSWLAQRDARHSGRQRFEHN